MRQEFCFLVFLAAAAVLLSAVCNGQDVTVQSALGEEVSWDADIWQPAPPSPTSSVVLHAAEPLTVFLRERVSISDIQVGGNDGAETRLVIADNNAMASSLLLSHSNVDVSQFSQNSFLELVSSTENTLALTGGVVHFGPQSQLSWTRGEISGASAQTTAVVLQEGSIFSLLSSQPDYASTAAVRSLSAITLEVRGATSFSSQPRDGVTELHVAEGCDFTVAGGGSVAFVDNDCTGLFLFEESNVQLQDQSSYATNCPHTFAGGSWSIENSALFLLTDTSLDMEDAQLSVTGSSLSSYSSSELSFSDVTVSLSDSGSLAFSDSEIGFEGSIATTDNSALVIEDGSEMEMSGSLSIGESSHFTLSSSELVANGDLFCATPETLTCYCNCNVTAAATVTCDAGTTEEVCLGSCLSSGVQCTGSECTEWQCEGYCEPSCPVSYVPTHATIELRDNAETIVEDFAVFILQVGEVLISESHQLILRNESDIEIFDGVFIANDTASMMLEDGSLEVAGGSLIFGGSSRLEGINSSELEASLGTIRIEDNASMTLQSSAIEMTGGNLVIAGEAFLFAEAVADFDPFLPWVDDGDVAFSQLEVTQGGFEILDNALVSLTNATEITVRGTFRLADSATLDMHSSTMNVTSSLHCAELHYMCSCSCGVAAPLPEYSLLCSGGVSEEVCEAQCFARLGHEEDDEICTDECVVVCPTGEETSQGTVSFEGFSTSSFTHTGIFVTDGVITIDNSHTSTMASSFMQVIDGDLFVREDAFLSMDASDVSIVGGGLISMEDSSTWVQSTESSIHMSGEGGELNLGGSSFVMNDSAMEIDDGQVAFSSNVVAVMNSSTVTVSGGDLFFTGSSTSTFSSSAVAVDAGTVTAKEFSATALYNTDISISASLVCEDAADFTVAQSSTAVISGSLQAYDESTLLVTGETTLTIGSSAGDSAAVRLHDTSHLTIDGQSTVEVIGNLRLSQEATLEMLGSSTVVIKRGGNLIVADNSTVSITGNSLMDVRSGDVECGNFATIIVSEDSELRVRDRLSFHAGSSIKLSPDNAMVVDEDGIVVFEDSVDISGPSGATLGTSGDVFNSGRLDFSKSGGRIHTPLVNYRNGRVVMGDSTFSVTNVMSQGNMQFSGSRVSTVAVSNSTSALPLAVSSDGEAQGRLKLNGDYHNAGKLQHDAQGGTKFEIEGQFVSSDDAEVYILITDPGDRGQGFSYVSAKGGAHLGGTAVICIPNNIKFKGKVKVMEFKGLQGRFDRIIYQCTGGHQANRQAHQEPYKSSHLASREVSTLSTSLWSFVIGSLFDEELPMAKSDTELLATGRMVELEEEVEMEGGGCTKTSLSSSSFSVLFDGCDNGNGNGGNAYTDGDAVIRWLSLGVFVVAIIVVVVVSILFVAVPPLRRLMLGSEGLRITTVRRARQSSLNSSPTLATASSAPASGSDLPSNSSLSSSAEVSAAPQLQFAEL